MFGMGGAGNAGKFSLIVLALEVFAALFVLLFFVGIISGPGSGLETANADTGADVTTACGEGTSTLISAVSNMLPGDDNYDPIDTGKLGHEQHLTKTLPTHYCGINSGDCDSKVTTHFVDGHTTDQERWYINARWFGWTANGMRFSTKKGAADARKAIKHAKLIITITEPGKDAKSVIVSAEEYGPGEMLHSRDGIDFGAPPEVYKYLDGRNPYTQSPGDKHSQIKITFAKDQSAKLGPCK